MTNSTDDRNELFLDALAAFAEIDALDPPKNDADDDLLDDIRILLADNTHDLLLNAFDYRDDLPNPIPPAIFPAFDLLHRITRALPSSLLRSSLSQLALSLSLCPMHFCDYAICFDDDIDECSQIRALFPSHDT